MVIMAEISSLSPPPPLDFQEEGFGESEGYYGPVTQSEGHDFNKREPKERLCMKTKDLRED